MADDNIAVIKVRDVLMITMPADPGDTTVSALQEKVMATMV